MLEERSGPAKPITWMGVGFAFAFLLLSLFLPNRSSFSAFRLLFPSLLWPGIVCGLAFGLVAAWAFDIGAPKWTGPAGKLLLDGFYVDLAVYVVNPFRPGYHGVLLGPLMVALLLTLLWPTREREIFSWLNLAQLIGTGAVLFFWPDQLQLGLQAPPAGALALTFWAAALLQVAARWRTDWSATLLRTGFYLSVLPFGLLSLLFALSRDLYGAAVPFLFMGAALTWGGYLGHPWRLPVGRYQRRLIAGMILLSTLPVLTLGAVAVDALDRLHQHEAQSHLASIVRHAGLEAHRLVDRGETVTTESLTARMDSLVDWEGISLTVLPLARAPQADHMGSATQRLQDGNVSLTAYITLPDLGLYLAATQLPGYADQHVRLASWGILAGTLVGIGLVAAVGLAVLRRLNQRLWRMQEAVEAVGTWEFDIRLPLPEERERDELFALAGAINRMATKLESSHTELQQQNRELEGHRHQLKTRAEQQAAVADLARFALSGATIAELTDEAVRVLAAMLGAEYTAIAELLPDGSLFRMSSGVGWPPGVIGRILPYRPEMMPGYAIHTRGPIITGDFRSEDRFAFPPLLLAQSIRSAINIAIDGDGRPYGVLGAFSTQERAYTPDDAAFLEALAGVLATAVQRRRLEQQTALQYMVTRLLADGDGHAGAVRQLLEAFCRTYEWPAGALLAVGPEGRLQADQVWVDCGYEWLTERLGQITALSPTGPATVALRDGKAVWVPYLDQERSEWDQVAAGHPGVIGTVLFPIRTEEQPIAVVQFFSSIPFVPDAGLENFMHDLVVQIGSYVTRRRMEAERAELLMREKQARQALEFKAAEVQELNAGLEARVARRTEELQAAVRELESFSYSVSHDLRAPLRTINGFSQALLEDYGDSLNGTGRDFMDRVRTAAQEMGRRIDAMLTLSRVTRAEMAQGPVDLSELARTVAEELKGIDPVRSVEFIIQDGLKATGDGRLLRVALENLLANGWKFTARCERARIEVGQEVNRGQMCFYVRDNGAGFDMAYADKLFRPFQRLHSGSEFPGTGVGLATVARIVRRHGGAIWAESAPGAGATFFFTLE